MEAVTDFTFLGSKIATDDDSSYEIKRHLLLGWCDCSPRAKHPGMQSQMGLRNITTNKASRGDGIIVKLFQILKDDAVESAVLNMPANLENSVVATGLEKVNVHSNPKERQCQRMFKLPHNCINLTG